jgi:hypothetical protein
MTTGTGALRELEEYARGYGAGGLRACDARAYPDVRRDGEPVTRVVLVLDDPAGDTWDLAAVTELRRAMNRKAASLGLPAAVLSLIPSREAELIDAMTGR